MGLYYRFQEIFCSEKVENISIINNRKGGGLRVC